MTARRGAATRSRTLSSGDAEIEAERLRLEGWAVTFGSKPERGAEQRARKARALVIASHRAARKARLRADEVAETQRAVARARLELPQTTQD